MKEMGGLAPEERPLVGKTANAVKNGINQGLEEALQRLASGTCQDAEGLDVTLPGRKRPIGHKHPITQVMDDAIAIFRRMGFIVADGPDLETKYHNFDALNTPEDHPSRDVQDTFYLPDGSKATDNGRLVEALVGIARETGREPASPTEAREILGVRS